MQQQGIINCCMLSSKNVKFIWQMQCDMDIATWMASHPDGFQPFFFMMLMPLFAYVVMCSLKKL